MYCRFITIILTFNFYSNNVYGHKKLPITKCCLEGQFIEIIESDYTVYCVNYTNNPYDFSKVPLCTPQCASPSNLTFGEVFELVYPSDNDLIDDNTFDAWNISEVRNIIAIYIM